MAEKGKKSMRGPVRAVSFLLAAAFSASAVLAQWLDMTVPVPLERIVKNVKAYIENHPKDASGYYVLGRVHSLAFARAAKTLKLKPPPEEKAGKEGEGRGREGGGEEKKEAGVYGDPGVGSGGVGPRGVWIEPFRGGYVVDVLGGRLQGSFGAGRRR